MKGVSNPVFLFVQLLIAAVVSGPGLMSGMNVLVLQIVSLRSAARKTDTVTLGKMMHDVWCI